MNVARYLQSLVPEVVEFKVNTTVELNGRYTRTQLKGHLTDEQFKQIHDLQKDSTLADQDRQAKIGAKLREFFKAEKEAKNGKVEEMTWPNMMDNDNLPRTVNDAIRHLWMDETGGKNLRPYYEVFLNAIKPHIVYREFDGKDGLMKDCRFVTKEEKQKREVDEKILFLKRDEKSANLFAHGNLLAHKPTVQPATISTSTSDTVQAVVVGKNLEVKEMPKEEADKLKKADVIDHK